MAVFQCCTYAETGWGTSKRSCGSFFNPLALILKVLDAEKLAVVLPEVATSVHHLHHLGLQVGSWFMCLGLQLGSAVFLLLWSSLRAGGVSLTRR